MQIVNLFLGLNLLLCAVPAVVALLIRRWWMGILILVCGLAGLILGFAAVWASMAIASSQSGISNGDAGVLFVCSLPIGTFSGVVIGGAWGYILDERRKPRFEDHSYCPDCGNAMRGLTRLGCPKCGWKRNCPQCGYSLRGLMQTGCPECGWKRSG